MSPREIVGATAEDELVSQTAADPRTGKTFGELVPPRTHETSVIERGVRDFLIDAGYPVTKRRTGILCHHPDEGQTFLTLTPDIVLAEWRLVIEVDPCTELSRASTRGTTHRGMENEDRLRNDLLAAVGWQTLRLRLGASEGDNIGDRDVIVESSAFTKSAQAALTEALDDFKADREPCVRVVKKGPSPRPAKRRSHVVNIGEYNYSDDGYIFSWFPSLDSKAKVTLRLPMAGRFLYTHDRVPRFIAEVGLHEVPRDEWRTRLTDFLCEHAEQATGTTKWPWGDTILVGDGSPDAAAIMLACEHEKHTIDRIDFWFTVSGHPVQHPTPTALHASADQEPVVALHPDALSLGYRFSGVTAEHGYRGPYQRLYLSRDPETAT